MARRNDPGHSRTGTYKYQQMRKAVLDRDDGRCVICLRGPEEGISVEVDHIRRWADDGEDTMENLQTLCVDHHKAKSKAEAQAVKSGIPEPSRVWF